MSAFEMRSRGTDRLRRERSHSAHTPRSLPHWVRALLRIPLELKLLGTNLIIMLIAASVLFGPFRVEPTRFADTLVVAAALGAGAIVNLVLVRLELRPVKNLTQVAWLVSQGLLGARVPASLTADRELSQLSATINGLLDDLVAERNKITRPPAYTANRASSADRLRGIDSVPVLRVRS